MLYELPSDAEFGHVIGRIPNIFHHGGTTTVHSPPTRETVMLMEYFFTEAVIMHI